ncbi:hypothetical protein [Mycolicibacterium moriokaense]|uniref:Integral membrane protein n=1 Tax=Mycolicibacterium moriokaense TaxID=39691 RepID=A0A318HW43_9MYCO|nr:hypothetical protein [Mycolicibacterium moriokaense]PXX13027.1 hypothetical protein C8E89_101175 [Mycolicibacterium moriokaense]
MSAAAVAVTRGVSTAFGLVMVASAAVQADRPGVIAAVAATAAVLAGSVFRPAATIAVLLTVSVIVLADVPPLLTATSGLCAAAYLVLRHTAAVTAPTVVGAVGFTAAGLAAAALPIQLPWVPLAAPLAVLLLYVLVTRPFWAT